MSKFVNKPVRVIAKNGIPEQFYYHKEYRVEGIQEQWRESGQWWLEESPIHIYRVIAAKSVFELHFFPKTNQWLLYRIED
ncbi:MAG: hypothetical protein GX020_08675 [Firmicutes bacterium]|jgi:hypothetical protein|nr:hypothetical protein [Bacillota bacterium]